MARDQRGHRDSASAEAPGGGGVQRPAPAPSPDAGSSPAARRRAATVRTISDYDYECGDGARPGLQAGAEPGYDPRLPDGGHASVAALNAPCDISVVDFAPGRVEQRRFDNDAFVAFVERPKEAWARCRWINVNGLSWDVIQAVGASKGLHRLALEDVMNVPNRTKAEWYPNHAFIVLTLQKLVYLADDGDDGDGSSASSGSSSSLFSARRLAPLRRLFRGWASRPAAAQDEDGEKNAGRAGEKNAGRAGEMNAGRAGGAVDAPPQLPETSMLRSLQRFHASGNSARTEFMEKHSSLAPYGMAVAAEQVSVFLTSDNTVISLFEASAADVERPIVARLATPGTILRESCDASLLVQAILDAVVDLALPLTAVYTELLGDIELDVLTAPSVRQSRALYVCISEINKMLRFLGPVDNLVNVLRDHRSPLPQDRASALLEDPAAGVVVTPMTHTYLADVLDHCIIVAEALQQLKQSSEDLIGLIFNTVSANQNESMKQLTAVTIIFLPLTFITGFFGQNFAVEAFPELHHGIWYFWACAVPTAVATIAILMRDMIHAWVVRLVQRKQVLSIRRRAKSRRRRRNAAL